MTNLTIKTEQIDGYTIVTGPGQLSVDPESTKRANAQEIFDLPESVEMRKKSDEKSANITAAGHHKKTARFYLAGKDQWGVANPNADAAKFREHDDKYKYAVAGINVCDADLKEMTPTVVGKMKDIIRAQPVYNEPGAGEYICAGLKIVGPDSTGQAAIFTESELVERGLIVDVDKLIQLHLAKSEHQALKVDGEYVDDYRDVKYWCKTDGSWGKRTIVKLGEFPGATEIADADIDTEQRMDIDTQIEAERMAALTAEDLAAEYEVKRKTLVGAATTMRAELEIEADPDALKKSQEFYLFGLAELNLKYGVK